MSWLDNVISFISPAVAYKREAWKQSLDELRNYDAGSYGRNNANWRAINQSGEMTDRYCRDNVRARARDLERNSDVMNSVVKAYKRNIVGGDILYRPKQMIKNLIRKLKPYGKYGAKSRIVMLQEHKVLIRLYEWQFSVKKLMVEYYS